MSSSSDSLAVRELRTGTWTRLGGDSVLGDDITEHVLSGLASSARDAARAQGYAIGWSEGRRAAEERARVEAAERAARLDSEEARRADEHAAAVGALQRAAALLATATREAVDRVESGATEVALQIAHAVVGRELEIAADPGADAVRRALALLPTEDVAVVRLHPADMGGSVELPAGARIVADPSLRRGDAVVETQTQVVDARISTALERVAEALLDPSLVEQGRGASRGPSVETINARGAA